MQGIWKSGQNTGKTQAIWFAQVGNSLILKVTDISIFTAKIPKLFLKLDMSTKSVCVCNSYKSLKLVHCTGKICSQTGKTQDI